MVSLKKTTRGSSTCIIQFFVITIISLITFSNLPKYFENNLNSIDSLHFRYFENSELYELFTGTIDESNERISEEVGKCLKSINPRIRDQI